MTWLAIALAVVIFAVDVFLLDGRAEAVLYVVVVSIFHWSPHWRYVLVVALACSVLTILGVFAAHTDPTVSANVANHMFSFAAMWLTAILGFRMNCLSERLAASEARTRTIVESAAEGIITIDDQGTVESFNEAAARMFGYEIDEAIGRNVTCLMAPGDRELHEQGLTRYLATGQKQIIGTTRGLVGMRKDGTTFPLLIAVSQMSLEGRRMFAGIVLDMTDLHDAQVRALQAERLAAIGEAMAALAHESRNALQRSQAALEMLARTIGEQPDALDLIARIQTAQHDLHQLYEDVRSYAAPITLRPEPCRVDLLVEEAWERLSVTRAERDARLQPTATHVNLSCDLDSFAVCRVFRNILENSLAAVDDLVRITVSYTEVTLDGRPAVQVSIHDNGPGLDDEARRKMFEPFYTTKANGTGLGMAIARRYIEAHGGVIVVPKNSGHGAEFRITLPRTQS